MYLIFKKIWNFLTSHKNIIYIISIIILSCLLINQCNRNSTIHNEINRLENNIYAISDTLKQFKDENNNIIAEKHAFQFTEKELRDSIKLLKDRNREYLAYINANIGIRDTVKIPTFIERPFEIDSTYYTDKGVIKFNKFDAFGKSNREFSVSIPYSIDSTLHTGAADVNMYHNIFVESVLERDKKTGESYVRLVSDYPYLQFNSGNGIIVTNSKEYEKNTRKTKGIGIGIGPSVGLGYDMLNHKIVPTVGVSVTLGFTYTPKWLQW